MIAYHVTASTRLDSIFHYGLLPAIGPAAKAAKPAQSDRPLIQLFKTLEDAIATACAPNPAWTLDMFAPHATLALIAVDIKGLAAQCEPESLTLGEAVHPSRLTLITPDIRRTTKIRQCLKHWVKSTEQMVLPGIALAAPEDPSCYPRARG